VPDPGITNHSPLTVLPSRVPASCNRKDPRDRDYRHGPDRDVLAAQRRPTHGADRQDLPARHPRCTIAFIDTGLERSQFEWLRSSAVDLLAMRLPVSEPDVSIGPILSTEERVLAVADDHPLATHDHGQL
jgi:hypothetical protein